MIGAALKDFVTLLLAVDAIDSEQALELRRALERLGPRNIQGDLTLNEALTLIEK